jgi:opacity protein-like surface antigen
VKKTFGVVVVLFMLLILPGVSMSGAAGPYVSGQIGLAFLSNNEMSYGPVTGTMEFDPGFEFNVTGGYNFGMFRVEGEIGYQKNDIDKVNGCFEGGFGGICVSDVSSSGNATILSFLANGYFDFVNKTAFTPYITAGIGEARIKINDFSIERVKIGDSADTVLAYQVGAGVAYAVNKNFTIDLKYRYISMVNPEFEGMDAEISIHHVYLGLRYNF